MSAEREYNRFCGMWDMVEGLCVSESLKGGGLSGFDPFGVEDWTWRLGTLPVGVIVTERRGRGRERGE